MAARSIEYKKVNEHFFKRDFDLTAQPVKLALLASTYHPVGPWAASSACDNGDYIQPTTPNNHYYRCTVAGTSGSTEPASWPTDGSTTTDGSITWMDMGTTLPIVGAKDDVWADVSAHEVTGTGYAAGGQQLTSVALDVSADETILTADLVEWSSSTITARWAVLYQDATINGVVKPLLACVLLDDTPTDVSSNDSTFSYVWGNCGVYPMRAAAYSCPAP